MPSSSQTPQTRVAAILSFLAPISPGCQATAPTETTPLTSPAAGASFVIPGEGSVNLASQTGPTGDVQFLRSGLLLNMTACFSLLVGSCAMLYQALSTGGWGAGSVNQWLLASHMFNILIGAIGLSLIYLPFQVANEHQGSYQKWVESHTTAEQQDGVPSFFATLWGVQKVAMVMAGAGWALQLMLNMLQGVLPSDKVNIASAVAFLASVVFEGLARILAGIEHRRVFPAMRAQDPEVAAPAPAPAPAP